MNLAEFKNMIQASLEDDVVPEAVLDWVRANSGKQLWRVADSLRAINPEDPFEVRCRYGSTHLTTKLRDRGTTGPCCGFDFHLSRDTSGVRVPSVTEFEELNPAYYVGRRQRNAVKRAILERPEDELIALLCALTGVVGAIHQTQEAVQKLQATFSGVLGDWSSVHPIEDAFHDWMRQTHGDSLKSVRRIIERIGINS